MNCRELVLLALAFAVVLVVSPAAVGGFLVGVVVGLAVHRLRG